MTKEFIPYEQALELKQLGFDEHCFGYYDSCLLLVGVPLNVVNPFDREQCLTAPLYQQAFRFFREKYSLHGEPYTADMGAIEYSFQIRDLYSEKYVYDNFKGAGSSYCGTFNTYEESKLECLKKLIEIVKNK